MAESDKLQWLRKHWYVVLILAVVAAAIGYCVYHSGKDPVQLLREYGYWIILGWTFLEGETIVVIAGWASERLGLEPWLIALSAFCGSFLSDQVMFSLGKYKGEAVLLYFPRIARNVDKAAKLFKKYDTLLILGFRFVYGVRNVTPILLGISGVSHKKFFCLNFIGASVWAVTFTYGGLYAGKAFMRVMDHVGHGIFYVLLGGLAVAGLVWFIRAHHSVKRAKEVAERRAEEAAPDLPQPDACQAAAGPEACAAVAAGQAAKAQDAPGGSPEKEARTGTDTENEPPGEPPGQRQ